MPDQRLTINGSDLEAEDAGEDERETIRRLSSG
jgi:hypothetical protein